MPAGSAPALLSQVLLARIEQLNPEARRLLEVIAVAVRPLTLQAAALCNIGDIQSSLKVLISHRLVASQALAEPQPGFKPYTEHIRQVVLRSLPEDVITEHHNRLAQALESLPSSEPEWLLAHYRGAGQYEPAKRYSIIVAKRALGVLAFEQAASMFRAALDLTSDTSPDWVELNVSYADALGKAGRGGEAALIYERAATSASSTQRAMLLNMAVTHWVRSGHIDKGVRLMRTTLEVAGIAWPETSNQAIVRLLGQRAVIRVTSLKCELRPEKDVPQHLLQKLDALAPAQTSLGSFDYLRGATFAAIALPLALKAREPKRLVAALGSEAIYGVMLGGLGGERRAMNILHQINVVRECGTGPYESAGALLVGAMCAYWTGHWKDVPLLAAQAETILRRRVAGALWELNLLRSIRHTVLLLAGRQRELAKELPDELSRASVQDDHYAHFDLLRRSVGIHLMHDGVPDALSALSELAAQREQYPFLALDHLIMSSVVATHLYAGDAATARRELDTRWQQCSQAGMDWLPLVRLTVIGMQFDCLMAAESVRLSERLNRLEKLARAAGKERIAWAPALRATVLGVRAELSGKLADAALYYRRSAAIYRTEGLSAAAAVAEWRLLQVLQPESAFKDLPESENDKFVTPERPESFLREAGIVRPERWVCIVHSLY